MSEIAKLNSYFFNSVLSKDGSIMKAEIKMFNGKTSMIVVEGITDLEFYKNYFNVNSLRCVLDESDIEELEISNFIPKGDLTSSRVSEVLSDDKIKLYKNVIGICDKDFKTFKNNDDSDLENNRRLFYTDKHDLEMTILYYEHKIKECVKRVFKLKNSVDDLFDDIYDICLKISAIRYVHLLDETNCSINKCVKNGIGRYISVENDKILFNFEGFIKFVDKKKYDRSNRYKEMYKQVKKSKFDFKYLFVVGHDFVKILFKYLKLKSNIISEKEIEKIFYDVNNSYFNKSNLYNNIKNYQKCFTDVSFITENVNDNSLF